MSILSLTWKFCWTICWNTLAGFLGPALNWESPPLQFIVQILLRHIEIPVDKEKNPSWWEKHHNYKWNQLHKHCSRLAYVQEVNISFYVWQWLETLFAWLETSNHQVLCQEKITFGVAQVLHVGAQCIFITGCNWAPDLLSSHRESQRLSFTMAVRVLLGFRVSEEEMRHLFSTFQDFVDNLFSLPIDLPFSGYRKVCVDILNFPYPHCLCSFSKDVKFKFRFV